MEVEKAHEMLSFRKDGSKDERFMRNQSSYSPNILLLLANMKNGSGAKECYTIASILGLLVNKHFVKNYPRTMSQAIYNKVKECRKQSVDNALLKEMKMTYNESHNDLIFIEWLGQKPKK